MTALVARDHDGAGESNAAMNAFWGADTDQLEQHATAMHTAAQRLVELQEQLSSLVMDEAIWRGSDADSFRERWQSDALQASERVAGDIDTKADEIEGHASEQDGASGEGGIGGGIGGAVGGMAGGAIGGGIGVGVGGALGGVAGGAVDGGIGAGLGSALGGAAGEAVVGLGGGGIGEILGGPAGGLDGGPASRPSAVRSPPRSPRAA
ncbi:hypothetical protein [Brachybacterium conglomeratum]|uniref:hypothetical protein n=1 Tax=Brachybacterium conglomeratum TaxID=47846 RepID=UPI003DA12B19